MAKRKATRGRRGGGNTSRKTPKVTSDDNEAAENKANVDSSLETAEGIEESEVAGDSTNDDTGAEDTVEDASVLNDNIGESSLEENTAEGDANGTCDQSKITSEETGDLAAVGDLEETDINNSANVAEGCGDTAVDDVIQVDHDNEPALMCDLESNEAVGEQIDELSTECPVGHETEQGEELSIEDLVDQSSIASEHEEDEFVEDSMKEEEKAPEQHSEELSASISDHDVAGMEVCSADKEVEGDQREVEEVQYIDEEACEDQQSTDIMESQMQATGEENELLGEDDTHNSGQPTELDADDLPASLINSDVQKDEDIDNSKFEEISEGSIDQDQEELAVEPISDVEITGETFESNKSLNDSDIKEESTKVHYKEPETLEEVFFATENDDLKITAEDKDNDDVSDTSLSNHDEANLSLEEISDEEMEPSKKRKKSTGVTPVKAGSGDEKPTADVSHKSVDKSEAKPNQKSTSQQKRPANDEGNSEGVSSKRLKVTNETKDKEETPRSEHDVTGDIKKDGKKTQAKDSDVFHGRNVSHNRNLSQSSKNGQQESRDRAYSSRDSAEHKRRHELVSTMCQTEPRQLKGKIVQCNINPVKLTPEQPVRISEQHPIASKLLTKFRKQLPTSIPEKIFLAVTSLHPPPVDNTYSFSMGPVTLSDMDSPMIQIVTRDVEEFSLTFDKHIQGIQRATVGSHEHLTSLISHLKNLKLGNRYMVLSFAYKHGVQRTVSVWKATLLYMFEQDIQMESQSLVNDRKVRAKLCLKGIPKDVSKDFIQLLFPEAITVSSSSRWLEERSVTLGFSNDKFVEEIISCYDLLIICGSQVTISRVETPESDSEASKAILKESTKDVKEAQDKCSVNKNDEQENESCEEIKDTLPQTDQTNPMEIIQTEDVKEDRSTQNEHETTILSENSVQIQKQEKSDKSTKENESLGNTDACAEATLTSEESLTVCASTSDGTPEGEKLISENITDSSAKQQTDEASLVSGIEKCEQEEATTVASVSVENLPCLEVDEDKPSSGSLHDAVLLKKTEEEENKKELEKQSITDLAANVIKSSESEDKVESDNQPGSLVKGDANESVDKMDADKQPDSLVKSDGNSPSLTADEDSSKLESAKPDAESQTKAEVPPDSIAAISLTNEETDSNEITIVEESAENLSDSNLENEVIDLENEVNKRKIDKNFEDISDEETGNQSKQEGDHEEVVIVIEKSPERVTTDIDLIVEELDTSAKLFSENEENILRPSSRTEQLSSTSSKGAAGDSGEINNNPKLVMTDGELEISMEVIDVTEGDQQTEKVIYARSYQPSNNRSRERRSWDARNYRTAPLLQLPWRENQWLDTNRPDPYYGSHEAYRHYQPKESASRTHYYPIPVSEESSHYRPPARESTSYRRESYYPKQKSHRYRSPSPRKDSNMHRHSSSHASDHRTAEHWDKKYDNWQPRAHEDSKRSESYSRPPAEYSGRQSHWQSQSTTRHSPPPSYEGPRSSARPRDHHSRGGSRGGAYDSDRRRTYKKSRSRSLSDLSVSSAEMLPPVRRSSYRRESPKRPVHTSRSPISVSSRSRSLSPVSKSPSVEYSKSGTGKDKLVKTVKHFLELAKGIKQAHRRQSSRSQSPKLTTYRKSKSPVYSRHRSPSVTSSVLRKALHSPRHTDSRRMRSRSPRQSRSRNSRSPYSRSQRRKHGRSSSASSHGDDYKRRYKERYADKRGGSYHRQSPDHYESRRPQKPETSDPANEQSSRSKSGQWSDSKYKSGSGQSWPQQPYGGYPLAQSSAPISTNTAYTQPYPPPPSCPPQQTSNVYSAGSSVPVYQYSNPSQFYPSIPPPYLQQVPPQHVPPPAPVSQPYQPAPYTVYQPPQQYTQLQPGPSGNVGINSNNASSKTKSWSMGSSAMVFQRVLGADKKGDKANKSGVERLERPKFTKTKRVLTTVQMEKK